MPTPKKKQHKRPLFMFVQFVRYVLLISFQEVICIVEIIKKKIILICSSHMSFFLQVVSKD